MKRAGETNTEFIVSNCIGDCENMHAAAFAAPGTRQSARVRPSQNVLYSRRQPRDVCVVLAINSTRMTRTWESCTCTAGVTSMHTTKSNSMHYACITHAALSRVAALDVNERVLAAVRLKQLQRL